MLCKNEIAIALSYDHKPQNAAEKERIENAGGTVSENRVDGNLALSRALGDFEYKSNSQKSRAEQKVTADPDITETDLTDDCRFVVLACDGIWDVKSSQECVDFLNTKIYSAPASKTNPAAAIKKGLEELLDHSCAEDTHTSDGLGTDNMTVVLVELKPRK